MEIICEKSLNRFEFWAGAVDTRNRFSMEEMNELERCIEDCFEGAVEETTVNDLFWFDAESLCEWLGLDFDEWLERPDDYWENSWRY